MAETVKPVEGVATSSNTFDDIFVAMLGAVNYNPATMAPLRYNPWGRNTLAVTGTATPVSVATGDAIVNGKHYTNTAAKNIAVGTPAAATRIDRVVLRIDYTVSPYTCTAELLAGAEGGAAPALTQTDGTTWEVSLAQVSITTGGVITVTDERLYVGQRTRTLFIPCTYTYVNGAAGSRDSGAGWTLTDDHNAYCYGDFYVPADYVSTMTISAVVYPAATGNIFGSNTGYQGAATEAYNTHETTTGGVAIAVSANQYAAIGPLTMSAIAAGDYVGLLFFRDGDNANDTVNDRVQFKGWLVSYTGM